MKKYLALLIAIVLCIGLFAGCGSSAATQSTSPSAAASPTVSAAAASSDLYKQANGKTYTIGTDTTFAPFEFEDSTGTRTGIDYQILNAIADKMGFKVEWQVLGFDAAVAALESGQVDAVMKTRYPWLWTTPLPPRISSAPSSTARTSSSTPPQSS